MAGKRALVGLVGSGFLLFFACSSSIEAQPLLPLLDLSTIHGTTALVQQAQNEGLTAGVCESLADPNLDPTVKLAALQAVEPEPEKAGMKIQALLNCLTARHTTPIEQLDLDDLEHSELFTLGLGLILESGSANTTLQEHILVSKNGESALLQSTAQQLLTSAAQEDRTNQLYTLILAMAQITPIQSSAPCQIWNRLQTIAQEKFDKRLSPPVLTAVLKPARRYQQKCRQLQSRQDAQQIQPWLEIQSPGTFRMSFDAQNRLVGASTRDTAIRIFSSRDGKLLHRLDTGEFPDSPRWLDGGRWLAFGDWKPSLHLYDGVSFEPLFSVELPQRATAVALIHRTTDASTNGTLAVGLFDGRLLLFSLESGELLKQANPHQKTISTIVFENGNLITGSLDRSIAFLDLEGQIEQRIEWKAGPFVTGAPNDLLLLRDFSDRVALYDPRQNQLASPILELPITLHDAAIHPTRPFIAAAQSSGVVSLFEHTTGRPAPGAASSLRSGAVG